MKHFWKMYVKIDITLNLPFLDICGYVCLPAHVREDAREIELFFFFFKSSPSPICTPPPFYFLRMVYWTLSSSCLGRLETCLSLPSQLWDSRRICPVPASTWLLAIPPQVLLPAIIVTVYSSQGREFPLQKPERFASLLCWLLHRLNNVIWTSGEEEVFKNQI